MGKYSSDKIAALFDIMKQLSEGRDPTSGIDFPDDSILNSVILKRAFADTSDILADLICYKVNKPFKIPFSLTMDEMNAIPISDEPLPISKFVFIINSTVSHPDMRKLYAKQLTEKLTQLRYLEKVIPEDGREYKISTELGKSLGICSVHKVNAAGNPYVTNLYDVNAQRFIIYELIPQLQEDL